VSCIASVPVDLFVVNDMGLFSNRFVLACTLFVAVSIFFSSMLALSRHREESLVQLSDRKDRGGTAVQQKPTQQVGQKKKSGPIEKPLEQLQGEEEEERGQRMREEEMEKEEQARKREAAESRSSSSRSGGGDGSARISKLASVLKAVEGKKRSRREEEKEEEEGGGGEEDSRQRNGRQQLQQTDKERAAASRMHPAAPDPALEPAPTQKPLACIESYEPTCPMYSYVRFWNKKFHPEDCYQSPLRHPRGKDAPVAERKYLVFEPDRGGWNNIRMAAETAMIFAHATGRILVMPPIANWYLLDRNKKGEENKSTFSKFFDLGKIRESIDIITMQEFLDEAAVPSLLNKPYPKEIPTSDFAHNNDRLWKYLESACYVREWEPGKIHIGFNITRDESTGKALLGPIAPSERRRKHAAHGRELIPYDESFHEHKAVYFPGDYRNSHRILTHFYTYLFWADPHVEHIYKRLVRDRLHYHDDIFCAAGRVIRMLHEEAAALSRGVHKLPDPVKDANTITAGGNSNKGATYHAFHIRRGDFQYKHTRMGADQIWNNTKHLLDPTRSTLVYIATDEKDKSFFEPFKKQYTVRFLRDYVAKALLGDGHLNQNHIGMVEQVICANAHTFIGTPLSTFTGYITRMRGYYRDNRYSKTFYTMPEEMYSLQERTEIKGPFWAREFAVAHKDIDDWGPQP